MCILSLTHKRDGATTDSISYRSISPMEELLVAYGGMKDTTLPTEDLLVTYGFAMGAQCSSITCGLQRFREELDAQLFYTALLLSYLSLGHNLLL